MDFLDPRKRRRHRRQLLVGYGLVAIAIILGAYLLVISAGGFGYDRKTGTVIVNGLLFLDSKPSGANIYINGQSRNSKTAARLILPAGNYSVTLKRDGYRDWTRSFTLTESAISRYVYPFLFPQKLAPVSLKNYPSPPQLVTSSPDQHWLLVQDPTVGLSAFDEYDMTDLKTAPKPLSIPTNLFTGPLADSQLKVVEWAADNKNILLQHDYPGGSEFVVFNRASTTDSFNVNKLFGVSPTQVALRNKKVDQLYLFNAANGNLQLGTTSSAEVNTILDHVLAFKPNGPDLILYVTDQKASSGQVWARIWNSGKTYPLYSFSAGGHYLIGMASYQGAWYYVVGSDTSGRLNIYKNPLDGLTNTASGKALPLISLRDSGADKLTFSTNARFIEAEAGQSFAVYDFETQTSYHYTLAKPLSANLHWMDGHRLIGDSAGQIFVTDYDSTNQQILVPTDNGDDIHFDPNFNHMLNLSAQPDGSTGLISTDLRAGADLPANP